MKHITLLSCITCLMLLVSSCQKDNNSLPKKKLLISNSGSIKGNWELRILYGGQIPNDNRPYFPPGNGNTYYFTDTTYLRTVQSLSPFYTASDSAFYILGQDTCRATDPYRMMDYFKAKDNPFYVFFEIKDDTLTLYQGFIPADGTIEKYVRY